MDIGEESEPIYVELPDETPPAREPEPVPDRVEAPERDPVPA